ncbi:MAG TPA: MscL family protein [Solirubrobacterales bacterium]|nr:MscL family protein [Solirubrobacterales bacterium]
MKEFVQRSDLITIAAGLLMALAVFALAQAVVAGLIAPLIAIFFGDDLFFSASAFTIHGSEFRYGVVIEAVLTFALAAAAVYFLLVSPRGHRWATAEVAEKARACPECTSSISVAAKRCPHCTAVLSMGEG